MNFSNFYDDSGSNIVTQLCACVGTEIKDICMLYNITGFSG